MKYKKRPPTIEAFQMTRETRRDHDSWPAWLLEAWNLRAGERQSLYATEHDGPLMLVEHDGWNVPTTRPVELGDYIVRANGGLLYVMTARDFSAEYEPVDDVHPRIVQAERDAMRSVAFDDLLPQLDAMRAAVCQAIDLLPANPGETCCFDKANAARNILVRALGR